MMDIANYLKTIDEGYSFGYNSSDFDTNEKILKCITGIMKETGMCTSMAYAVEENLMDLDIFKDKEFLSKLGNRIYKLVKREL